MIIEILLGIFILAITFAIIIFIGFLSARFIFGDDRDFGDYLVNGILVTGGIVAVILMSYLIGCWILKGASLT